MAADAAELLDWVSRLVPTRPPVDRRALPLPPDQSGQAMFPRPAAAARPKAPHRSSRSSNARRQCRMPSRSPMRRANGRPDASALHRQPLRRLCAADDPFPECAAASDQAGPVGRHGGGRPSPPLLPAASAAAADLGRHPVRRAARERDLCRRSACPPSRRLLHRRRDLRPRLGRTGRCHECRSLPPRLVSRRRHRRRQGPPGRRDHSRQLAQRPPPRRSGSPNPTN